MFTIEDLRNGKCAVKNDGTLEELEQVLKLAFPKDIACIAGAYNLYIMHHNNKKFWFGVDQTDLPTQSVKEFLKPKQMTEARIITWQQGQEIISAACNGWKTRLAVYWGSSIALKNNIEISERLYKEMRQACTREQHELFDKIFGKDEPECPYKDGDPVWVRDSNLSNDVWDFRYATGKFKVGKIETYINQLKRGETKIWNYHMPFDPNNLPVIL